MLRIVWNPATKMINIVYDGNILYETDDIYDAQRTALSYHCPVIVADEGGILSKLAEAQAK